MKEHREETETDELGTGRIFDWVQRAIKNNEGVSDTDGDRLEFETYTHEETFVVARGNTVWRNVIPQTLYEGPWCLISILHLRRTSLSLNSIQRGRSVGVSEKQVKEPILRLDWFH